ncbi:MAG: hypothetical protein E6I84_16465 [Chloroflexi bacterium]|nr:MAG: hypothetical protein E6I84_16465 [Chloroflexota bacterium]
MLRSLQAVAQLVPSALEPFRETYHDVPDAGDGLGVGAGDGVGVGDGVGDGVGPGAGVGVGDGDVDEATTTSCSRLELCPSASVTVKRTYLVPGSTKVRLIVAPLPRFDRSASSIQLYVHGIATQTVVLPSKETGWPVTGFVGE